jgi:hypothetical protein
MANGNPPANVTVARGSAKALQRLERQMTAETRSFGGRRTGFVNNEEEYARKLAMERHLLDVARRAVARHSR